MNAHLFAQRALRLLMHGNDAYRKGSGERIHRWAYDVVHALGGDESVARAIVRLGDHSEELRRWRLIGEDITSRCGVVSPESFREVERLLLGGAVDVLLDDVAAERGTKTVHGQAKTLCSACLSAPCSCAPRRPPARSG